MQQIMLQVRILKGRGYQIDRDPVRIKSGSGGNVPGIPGRKNRKGGGRCIKQRNKPAPPASAEKGFSEFEYMRVRAHPQLSRPRVLIAGNRYHFEPLKENPVPSEHSEQEYLRIFFGGFF